MNYLWTDETEQFRHKTLEKDISTDICIIGGGIAGIMCAGKYSLTVKATERHFELRKN